MKNVRSGRLSGSYDNLIKTLESEASEAQMKARQTRGMKRSIDEELQGLQDNLQSAKVLIFLAKCSTRIIAFTPFLKLLQVSLWFYLS